MTIFQLFVTFFYLKTTFLTQNKAKFAFLKKEKLELKLRYKL